MATRRIVTRIKDQSPHKDLLPDLQAPGLLAKWPTIGIIMFAFGSLLFGALTYNLLAQGPLLKWDRELAYTLPAIGLRSPAYIKSIMNAGFFLGKYAIVAIEILLSLYFFVKRYWRELAMVMLGGLGSGALYFSLSPLFARPRPPNQIWIIVNEAGFPSGHTIATVVCYGLLAYMLVPKMPSAFWKGFVVAAALLIIGLVGFSRLFTAGHYLTDVLAGFALGIAWSGLVFTWVEIYIPKRMIQNVKKE